MRSEHSGGAGEFPSTHWSLLLHAGDSGDSIAVRQAREELCHRYWKPLYLYARARGKPREDAEDLVQGFLGRLLDHNRFQKADPERGRFRTFLLTSFQRYMINDWEKATAQKRGGDESFVSLDFNSVERDFAQAGGSGLSPARYFDIQWAKALVSRSLGKLERSWTTAHRADLFAELKPFLTLDAEDSIIEIAGRMGRKPGSVRMSLSRLRDDYRVVIESTVAETLPPGSDLDEEIGYLVGLLLQN